MKVKYETPAFHLIPDFGKRPQKPPVSMSDEELKSYIETCTHRTYRANPDYVLRKIAGSTLIVPAGPDIDPSLESAMLTPSRTAAFLWDIFQSPTTLSDAVKQCIEHFSGPSDQIEIDVCRFIGALLEKGMLKEEENK